MSSPSKRKLNVTVNGKIYAVEVGDLYASPIHVSVNGQPYVVDVSTAEVEKVSGDQSAAALESVARSVSVAQPASAAPSAAAVSANTITAPMPGLIVEVLVHEGDEVTAGQEVCTLEAMKMKNAIRAARAGVIADVGVSAGQKVTHGQVLVTFE